MKKTKLRNASIRRNGYIAKYLKRYWKRHTSLCICMFLFVFPLIVGILYSLPLPQYIDVDSGELLNYYSIVFGLFFSFVQYQESKRKDSLERQKETRPQIHVEMNKVNDQDDVFEIVIWKFGDKPIVDAYLFEHDIGTLTTTTYKFAVMFNQNDQDNRNTNSYFNVGIDSDILDNDGFPKYIQILCYDMDDNAWVCEFDKKTILNRVVYIPTPPCIV